MGVDTTTAAGLLKRVYSDADVENLQNMETETWSRLKKSSKQSKGAGFYECVNLEGNQRGQGSMNELEGLRDPAAQVPQQANIQNKVFAHCIRYSGLSLEVADGDEGSFADVATFQVEEGIKDSAKELNAQLFRNGKGRLCQANGAVVATTAMPFDHGVPTHLRVGTYVDAINAGGVKQIDSIKITAVDISGSSITLASNQSCDDDSWIYRENVADNAPTDGKELAGLPLIVDDGTVLTTYQGIDRSVYNQYDGISIAAGSANISNDMLNRLRARMRIIGGKKPKKVISNTSQMRKYVDIIIPAIEFKSGEDLDTQKTRVATWNGMEWIEDTDCGFDSIYMYDPEYVLKYVLYPLRLDSKSGSTIKWDSGYDAFVSYLKFYGNIGTPDPHGVAAYTGLATPTY
jgi:hypothetical protein